MNNIILVYITVENQIQAEEISRMLLEKRLAACVNIISGICSMYWWQDKIQKSEELLLLAKCPKDNFDELCAQVKRIHSYETPCIVALPLAEGSTDFLQWVRDEATGVGKSF